MRDSYETRAYAPGEPGRVRIEPRPACGPATPRAAREMLAVHGAFRREFRRAVEAVRAAAPGDRARAALVAEHVQLTMSLLQHHHELEDQLLWAPLLASVGEEHAPTVLLIEAQHERISAQLEELQEATVAYAREPNAERQRTLARICAQLSSLLEEHLTAEERRLLPLAEQHVTEDK